MRMIDPRRLSVLAALLVGLSSLGYSDGRDEQKAIDKLDVKIQAVEQKLDDPNLTPEERAEQEKKLARLKEKQAKEKAEMKSEIKEEKIEKKYNTY